MSNLSSTLRQVCAATGLLIFAIVWTVLCIRLGRFNPTDQVPELPVSTFQATIATLLATSVATSIAAFLGVEVVKLNRAQNNRSRSFLEELPGAVGRNRLLVAAISVYLVIGISVLLVTFIADTAATEMFENFVASFIGLLLGAVTVVFRPSD